MLVSDITTAARDLYNATGDSYFSDTLMWNWIAQAQQELSVAGSLIQQTTTDTTTSGVQSYAWPTYAYAIHRVTVNGKKLKRITERQDDAVTLSNAASIQSGSPIYYTEWNKTISLRPYPDSSYTKVTEWLSKGTPITSAGQTPDLDDLWHFDMVDYLLWRMYSKDQNVTMMQFYSGKWDASKLAAVKYRAKSRVMDSFKTVQDEGTLPVTILGEA